MSGGSKGPPPWMTPEEGDEAGKKAAAGPEEEGEAVPPEEAGGGPAEGGSEAEPTPDDVLDEFSVEEEEEEPSAIEKELAETKDRMLRIAADYDNFRKRARREQEEARTRGREEVLREILPVFDNLERAVDAAAQTEGAAAAAIVDGTRMVQKSFEEGLARFGLKRFSAVGEVFDPSFHEAVAQIDSEEPAGTVVKEFQKGYMLGERLLRAAMVIVARQKAAKAPEAKPEEQGESAPDASGTEAEAGDEPDSEEHEDTSGDS